MKTVFSKIYASLKRNFKTILFDGLFLGIFIFLCYYPLPFLVYRPGGLIKLNDRISVEGGSNITGSYNMSYVTVARGTLPNLLLATIIDNWDIKKEADTLVYDDDYETNHKISQLSLRNSVDIAKLVAFKKAGYEVNIEKLQLVVQSIDENANTDLQTADQIESINDISCMDIPDLRAYISELELGEKVNLKVENEGGYQMRYAHVYEYEGRKVIGITFFENYEYVTPLEVDFTTKASEAGASGGLMLTLAVYDQIVSDDLTNGQTIVGTGTIDKEGNVGAIGGIKYKMLGAQRNKADVYFAPEDNCADAKNVYSQYKLDFDLVCVKNIDDAINYLNSIK